jgi:hypothetical protein
MLGVAPGANVLTESERKTTLKHLEESIQRILDKNQNLTMEKENWNALGSLSILSHLPDDIRQITLATIVKQIHSIVNTQKAQSDTLCWQRTLTQRLTQCMEKMQSIDKQTWQDQAKRFENLFEQKVNDLKGFTLLAKEIKQEEQPLTDWVSLYQTHRRLREVLFAFRVIGFYTIAPESQQLFYPEPIQEGILTSQPFSYQIVCNVSLLRKFLTYLYQQSLCNTDNSFLRQVINKEVGSDKVWRQEIKSWMIQSSWVNGTMTKKGKKRKTPSNEEKVKKSNRTNSLLARFKPRTLDLLTELISLETERNKFKWITSTSLEFTEEKYLQKFKDFLAQLPSDASCECKFRVQSEENSNWNFLRSAAFYQKRLKNPRALALTTTRTAHIQPGWYEDSKDLVLNWRGEICLQHQITVGVLQMFQNTLKSGVDRRVCFWKKLRSLIETITKTRPSASEMIQHCNDPNIYKRIEEELFRSSTSQKKQKN